MRTTFHREDTLFSLCGLNCGLCPMNIRGSCGGCFSDSPCYPTCDIAPCSVRHGGIQYCYECEEYPCARYKNFDKWDSLISHRNLNKDLVKAREIGIEAYREEQKSKRAILDRLLEHYDDGSKDVFYCLSCNLLPLNDLQEILSQVESDAADLPLSERIAAVDRLLYDCSARRSIPLTLNRKW